MSLLRQPKVCRVCRAPDNDDLISVQLVQEGLTIAAMVLELTAVEVTADRNLPQNVCLTCLDRVRSAYQLRRQCIESDQILRKEICPEEPPPVVAAIKTKSEPKVDDEEPTAMVKLEIEALDPVIEEEEEEDEDEEMEEETLTVEVEETSLAGEDTKVVLEEQPEFEANQIMSAQELIDILAPEENESDKQKPGLMYLSHYDETDYEVLAQSDHYEQIKFTVARCCGCSDRFRDRKQLLEHGLVVHKPNSSRKRTGKSFIHECPICYRLFANASASASHRDHIDADRYHCRECDLLLDSRKRVLLHLERVHSIDGGGGGGEDPDEEEQQSDEEASREGGSSWGPTLTLAAFDRSQFKLIPTDEGYDMVEFTCFRCCGCPDMFESREDFELHSRVVHLPERVEGDEDRPFECSICYQRFDRKAALSFHRNRPNKRRIVCRVCEGIFRGECSYRKHVMHYHGILIGTADGGEQDTSIVEGMEVDEMATEDGKSDTFSIHEIEYIEDLPAELDEDDQEQSEDEEEVDSEDEEDESGSQSKGASASSKYEPTRQRKQMAFIPGNLIRLVEELDGYNIVEITKERCCNCLKFFDSLEELNEHTKTHQTESLAEVLEETSTSKPPVRYECEFCLKKFDIAMLYVIHKRLREQKQFYQCRLCDFVIDNESRLKNHMLYNDQHAKFFNLIREDVSDRYDAVRLPGVRCCGCGSYFDHESSLVEHSRREHPRDWRKDALKRKQPCPVCDRRFTNSLEVVAHQKKKGSTTRFYCKLCEFESASEARMLKHLYSSIHNEALPVIEVKKVEVGYRKLGSVRYCCFDDCYLPFHDMQKLHHHVESEHAQLKEANLAAAAAGMESSSNSRQWQCDCCGQLFRTAVLLKQHQFSHRRTAPKSFVCSVCGEAKPNRAALTAHEMMKHTGERPFPCSLCDKRFTSRTILNSHMKCHFPKQYECSHCKEKFARGENLKRHIRHRHSEAAYCCSYCSRKLKTREAQVLHERSHTGEKPFQCRSEGCDKRYASITDRRRHEMASHTGERPHKCGYCTASFVRKRQLTVHERKHTGERPFGCDRCGKAFVDAPLLKKHTC